MREAEWQQWKVFIVYSSSTNKNSSHFCLRNETGDHPADLLLLLQVSLTNSRADLIRMTVLFIGFVFVMLTLWWLGCPRYWLYFTITLQQLAESIGAIIIKYRNKDYSLQIFLTACLFCPKENHLVQVLDQPTRTEQGLLSPSADQACRARVTIITVITWLTFSENTSEEEPCLTGQHSTKEKRRFTLRWHCSLRR